MNGKDLKEICDRAQITTGELANYLSVSKRTVDRWIELNEEIEIAYAYFIRTIFEIALLEKPLRKIAEKAFEISRFELISIFFVSGTRLVLLKDVARLQLLNMDGDRLKLLNKDKVFYIDKKMPWMFFNPETQKDLNVDLSISTQSLRWGEVVKETSSRIKNDRRKFFKHASNTLLSDGTCYSLLKIPYMTPSANGPTPIALLALDNKLEEINGEFQAKKPDENNQNDDDFFDPEKIAELKSMFMREGEKELKPLLELLGYQGENSFEPPVVPSKAISPR